MSLPASEYMSESAARTAGRTSSRGYHTDMEDQRQPPKRGTSQPEPPPSPARQAAFARFEAMRTFGTLGTLGLSFVFALIIGAALGWWLDKLTGWSPLFFILFFMLGLAAGVRNVYVTTRRFAGTTGKSARSDASRTTGTSGPSGTT